MAHFTTIGLCVGVICLSLLSGLLQPADASAFRGRIAELAATKGATPELEKALLTEIEEVLGSGHRKATEARLGRIEKIVRPTFNALPKNSHGRLGHSAVRYAMHRLFVQRHGWFVQGLNPQAGNESSSSQAVILEDGLPSYLQSLFETRVGGIGFDLHDLAVMAATVENLVHKEAMDRLEQTYRALERSPDDPVSVDEAHEVIDAYMAAYILGLSTSEIGATFAKDTRSQINEVYPNWPQTQKFVREVQTSVAPNRDELTYENVGSVVEEIGERYGRWQNEECRTLKQDLVALEDHGTGRVRIADFYRSGLDGNWQFTESIPYLREIGALDESDPSSPSVIIPNYIGSPANCLASSSYYSVCCLDECEDILGHIEEKVGTATATPALIIALVEALPSATALGNQTLSPQLLSRLDEVASYHGGAIPLHGRLFSQWLHLVYPRECPYPHEGGITAPRKVADWMQQTGKQASASTQEMQAALASQAGLDSTPQSSAMWTMQEELFASGSHKPASKQTSSLRSSVRGVVFLIASGSAVVAAWQTVTSTLSGKPGALLPTSHAKYV